MGYWSYNNNYYSGFENHFGLFGLLVPIAIFDLILRGYALWRAAKNNQNVWFIALLVVNSMGILPLIYLVLNREQKATSNKAKRSK